MPQDLTDARAGMLHAIRFGVAAREQAALQMVAAPSADEVAPLLTDPWIRVVPMPPSEAQGSLRNMIWDVDFRRHVPLTGLISRLTELGMACRPLSRAMWQLAVVDPRSLKPLADLLVIGRSQRVVIRIDGRIALSRRRTTALRIAKTLGLVSRTFGRRTWYANRSRSDISGIRPNPCKRDPAT